MSEIITLTAEAAAHIQQMLEKQQGIGFRLSIKKTGCSGFAYVPAIVNQVAPEDLHFVTSQGLPVYVDQTSAVFVKGLIIDYVADTSIGLRQKRLIFINPNEKNRCGCGESFTIE